MHQPACDVHTKSAGAHFVTHFATQFATAIVTAAITSVCAICMHLGLLSLCEYDPLVC